MHRLRDDGSELSYLDLHRPGDGGSELNKLYEQELKLIGVSGVHQEENTFGVGKLQEAVDESDGGKGFS